MKSISLALIGMVIVLSLANSSDLYQNNAFRYVDIGECVLPIEKKLHKIEKWDYVESDYAIDPKSVTVAKADKQIMKLVKNNLHLKKIIYIQGYKAFIDEKKCFEIVYVTLKDHDVIIAYHTKNEINYMLSYCKKTFNGRI